MRISLLVLIIFFANISSAQTIDFSLLNNLKLVPVEGSECDAELCSGAAIELAGDELYITFAEHRPRIRLHFPEPNTFAFGWSKAPSCWIPACRDVVSIVGFATVTASMVKLSFSFTEHIIKEDSMRPFFRTGVGNFHGISDR